MPAGALALALSLASPWHAAASQSAPRAEITSDWLTPDDASFTRAVDAAGSALAGLGYEVHAIRFGPDEARDVERVIAPTAPAGPALPDVMLSVIPAQDAGGWAWLGVRDIGPDGFRLATAYEGAKTITPGGFVKLIGDGPRGEAYGLHEFARRVRLREWAPGQALDVLSNPAFTTRLVSFHDNPGEPPFASRYRDPAAVLDAGFNGVILQGLAGVCLYDAFDKRLVPEGSEARTQITAAREALRAQIAAAKAEHLLVFLNGDMIALPATALTLYGTEVSALGKNGKSVCFSAGKPKVHELIRATIDEVLDTFPDVDGIQVRVGEVYVKSDPTLAGNSPIIGTDDLHPDWGENDKLAAVVNTLRDEVVVKHGKRFNQRAWGYYTSAHSSPEAWADLAARIAPDPRLTFSFKQTKTDFWRWNILNPNFGLGPHGQWAEFQMAREYEGKGAFPDWLGRYLAAGATEVSPGGGLRAIRDAGVQGAWCWVRGGGWDGPYLQREDWVLLNTYAFARLLWDPDANPAQLAREFAVLELGVPADRGDLLARFATIQRLSEEAVLKGRYMGVFIAKGHLKAGSGWTPDDNWSRDDLLGIRDGVFPAVSLYRFLKEDGTVDDAIREKQEALAAWSQLMAEFEALIAGLGPTGERATQWDELRNTAVYGESWMQAACEHFVGCWKACQWDDGGRTDTALAAQAADSLRRSEAAWARHVGEIAALPGVATPYAEHGISQEREAMRAMLAGGPRPKSGGG